MDTKTRDFRLLIYLAILALIFCASYFGIYPALIETKKTKQEYSAYKKLLQDKEETLEDFNEAAAIYKKNSDFKKIDQLLLEEVSDKIFLLVQFEVLASKNNMATENFSFGELASGDGNLGIIPVNLSVKGGYSNFKKFLDSIATNLPLMEVASIQFSPSGESSNLYNFLLTVNVYTKESLQSSEPQEGQVSDQNQSGTSSSNQTTSTSPTPTPTNTTSPTTTPTTNNSPATP